MSVRRTKHSPKVASRLSSNAEERIVRKSFSTRSGFWHLHIHPPTPGARARAARARFPEPPRWAAGRKTPRATPARRRSAEKETRATAWCVIPRVGSLEGFSFPARAYLEHTPRTIGVADACVATRPGSRPHASAHTHAVSSPSSYARVRGCRVLRASLRSPHDARGKRRRVFLPNRKPHAPYGRQSRVFA